jgi:hypothetical protein
MSACWPELASDMRAANDRNRCVADLQAGQSWDGFGSIPADHDVGLGGHLNATEIYR